MRRWCIVPTFAVALLGLSFVQGQETVKDRKAYFPNRKSVALKEREIGILLTDGQPILSTEGRSGPADQLVFSAGGNSYRWVYVPTTDNPPLISNLQVPVGDKGEKAIYAALNMANPKSVLTWQVMQPYSLVEVDINNGCGSPAGDSFVGSSFRVLDGSKEYPIKVADAIKQVKDRYADYLGKQQKAIDQAMKDGAEKALKGKAPTGPREKKDLMYVTWLQDSSTMRVAFKTTISDGAYTVVKGGGPLRDPPPLPLPPKKGVRPAPKESPVALRIAPRDFNIKTGTTFGIELGQAYIVSKTGEVVGTETLPIEHFTQQLAVPFGGPRPALPAEKE